MKLSRPYLPFFVLGIAFMAIGMALNVTFLATGVAFIVLAVVLRVKPHKLAKSMRDGDC